MTPMRRALLLLMLLPFFAAPCFSADLVLNRLFPMVVLKDGRVLKNVTFVASGSSTAMAKWDGGRGTIPLDLLPDDLGASPAAAAPPVERHESAAAVAFFDKSKAPGAQVLADRSLSAEGGQALIALGAIQFQGEMGPIGEGTPTMIVAAPPNFRLTEILLPQGRLIEGFGPKGAWSAAQKTGGAAAMMKPAAHSPAKRSDLEESFIEPLWRWRELNATLAVIGEELVTMQNSTTSVRTYVVSVTLPDGSRWDYLIPADDPKMPYLVKRSYRGEKIVATERRSRFRRIGDLMLPMQYEYDEGNGRTVEFRIFRVVLNPPLEPETFLGPPSPEQKGTHL